MKIYAIRHGQTDYNVDGLAQGRSDIPLNNIGKTHTLSLKDEINKINYKTIIVSPLKRTKETAEILFPNHNFIFDERIIERSFGELEGDLISKIPLEIDDFDNDNLPYGIEPLSNVYNRVKELVEELKEEQQPILFVTHGGVMNILHYLEQGIPEDNHCEFQFRQNSEIACYEIRGDVNESTCPKTCND